jgi:hypothetical protein
MIVCFLFFWFRWLKPTAMKPTAMKPTAMENGFGLYY